MRVIVDVSPLSHPRTGIGNYVVGMIAGLAEAIEDRHELVAFAPTSLPGKRRIEEALAGIPVTSRLGFLPFAHHWRTAWSRLGRPPLERFLGRFDVLHFSDWMYPPQRDGIRATTIHDLIPLRFPEWVTPRTRSMHTRKYRNAARTCDLVFVNSRYTGDDVRDRLGVAPERIRVAYPGLDPRFGPEGDRADLGGPYLLAVSTLEPRKNLATLVQAFAQVRKGHPDLQLALAGPAGWGEKPILRGDGIRRLGFVCDGELERLYRGASAFVFPSSFEGFGMPVVEALASGTPAVVSAHPSLDEASGEAAFRADPTSAEAFALAIEAALSDGGDRIEPGLAQARQFTRRACGEAVLAGYVDVGLRD